MKTFRFLALLFSATLVLAIGGTSCGNKSKTSASTEKEIKSTSSLLQVDDVLENAEAYTDKRITVEGVCTHVCKHAGCKIFLMGSDDTRTIRIEAAQLGHFDVKCLHNVVTVTGVLKEQRIDEAYLKTWESKKLPEHGNDEAGCDNEKKARGETANTDETRIAEFRAKIAQQKEETGKEYLSFYFIEAISYKF
jgi:hypothetical protein